MVAAIPQKILEHNFRQSTRLLSPAELLESIVALKTAGDEPRVGHSIDDAHFEFQRKLVEIDEHIPEERQEWTVSIDGVVSNEIGLRERNCAETFVNTKKLVDGVMQPAWSGRLAEYNQTGASLLQFNGTKEGYKVALEIPPEQARMVNAALPINGKRIGSYLLVPKHYRDRALDAAKDITDRIGKATFEYDTYRQGSNNYKTVPEISEEYSVPETHIRAQVDRLGIQREK